MSQSCWIGVDATRDRPVEVHFARRVGIGRRERAARRFEQMTQLVHRCVQTVYDHGVLRDGTPYVVTDPPLGESLEARLERQGWLSVEECAALVDPVCDALTASHGIGLFHGAIGPRMLRLSDGATGFGVTLVGFQAAVLEPASGRSAYLEIGAPADAVADLWALAVTAHEALVGDLPFVSEIAPSDARKGVPRSIDPWFARALHGVRPERYLDAADFGAAYAAAWREAHASGVSRKVAEGEDREARGPRRARGL